MVGMAQDENPNHFLAKLSIYWAEQNNKGNPVESATHLVKHRQFRSVVIPALIIYAIIVAIWRPSMTTGDHPSIWMWPWFILGGSLFLDLVLCWDSDDGTSFNEMFNDAKKFIAAVTELENAIGKPLEQWTSADGVQEKAMAYLKQKAESVKFAEKLEQAEKERKPWDAVDKERMTRRHRYSFEASFELLTRLLPLPKDKGIYYGDKTLDEAPAN